MDREFLDAVSGPFFYTSSTKAKFRMQKIVFNELIGNVGASYSQARFHFTLLRFHNKAT